MFIEITKDVIIPILSLMTAIVVSTFSHAKDRTLVNENKKISENNLLLKEQIRLLTEFPLNFKNGLWYSVDGYPFCPVCYGKEGHKIPLIKRTERTNAHGYKLLDDFYCHACEKEIDIPDNN